MPSTGAPTPAVSIVVPAYNEKDTIREVIERLLALDIDKQIVVVNDGSTDGTEKILEEFKDKIIHVNNPNPGGKGKAIRAGIPYCTGQAIIIQDADLEYLPEEIPLVVGPIIAGEATVVYGSRFINGMHPKMALPNKLVNILLRWAVFVLFGKKLTDEATCYKAFRRDLLTQMNLTCERFEFCPEVTAKSIILGHEIKEVPINYEPRSKAAGKKIRWTDAPEAFITLLKNRFWKADSQKQPTESSESSKF